ncbi:MAG: cobalamin-dependent protein [Thaumarchaeota archaeon]|nr:cobalamin-dependent protein [Nitrososphaerota archaeon]MCL5316821.1 cobalamin-dependent protein [Nitrososphaerota archaeon]
MPDVDVLFFQPAVGKQYGIISLGILSLSAYLRKHGYDSRIVVLVDRDTEETVRRKMRQFHPKVVCISLHWYIHSYEALKVAEAVKAESPETKVVVGGHTSTYFNKQILDFTSAIDLIVKGDGEKPLLDYVSTLDPERTENASFMKDGEFVSKPITYHQTSLEDLSAANKDMNEMVDEWDHYLKTTRVRTSAPIPSGKIVEKVSTKSSEFYLYVGKGCSYNCCFCGTSKTGSTRIFSRGVSIFRPVEDVVRDANLLKDNGVESLFLDFGPFKDEIYFQKLFAELKPLDVDLTFLPWNLPSNELLSQVGESFRNFEIQISPDSGSERLRDQLCRQGFHKQFYTNNQLSKAVEKIAEIGSPRGAQLFLWFICGLPFETEEDFQETVKLSLEMKKQYPQIFQNPQDQLECVPLRLTPGSPIDLFPKRFNMRRLRSSFKDYYEYCRDLGEGKIEHPLGLEREDLTEAGIIKRAVEYKDAVTTV